ncbi:InlB B-repeat-containing protein, partial [Candidatus Saccharibacteria bacterium]|nr:InlB B-repeat-containing protein [Candidatus Saccharibacteria bacterium]
MSNTEATNGTLQDSIITLNVIKDAALKITPKKADGTFASTPDGDGATGRFSVETTNVTGYSLSISAGDDSRQLAGAGHALNSISENITAATFDDDKYNGLWGYKPNQYMVNNSIIDNSDKERGLYLPAPTTTAIRLDKTSAPNSGSANIYTIDLAARVGYDVRPGNYSSTYALVAVGNPMPYTINFDANTTDLVDNMPASQSGSGISDTSVTISDDIPTRAGYTFGGWCSTATNTEINGSSLCNQDGSVIYSAGGEFIIEQTTPSSTTLHAIWNRNGTTFAVEYDANGGSNTPAIQVYVDEAGTSENHEFKLDSSAIPTRSGYKFVGYSTDSSTPNPTYKYYASINDFVPNNFVISKSTNLTKNKLYAVWVTHNYMQGATDESLSATMSSNGKTATLKDIRDDKSYLIVKMNNQYWMAQNLTITGTVSPSNTNFIDDDFNVSANDLIDDVATFEGNHNEVAMSHVGVDGKGNPTVWYNACAASAGTDCQEIVAEDMPGDICPNGWRLPTNQEFLDAISNNRSLIDSYFSVYGGDYKMGLLVGGAGDSPLRTNYWSATANLVDSSRQEAMFYNNDQDPGTYPDPKYYGFYTRCVFDSNIVPQKALSKIDPSRIMQDIDDVNLSSFMPANGDSTTLYDLRDKNASEGYQTYQITNINGNYWMTEDLKITGTI